LGTSDPAYEILFVNRFLAETEPAEVNQDFRTGLNDLKKAKAASFRYSIKEARNDDLDQEFYTLWERTLSEEILKLNKKNKAINIELFSQQLLQSAFSDDIQADLALI